MSLSTQRCFNHAAREAVACCPECRRFHCRECVTDFRDRLLCTACISALQLASGAAQDSRRRARLYRGSAVFAGFIVAWLSFVVVAQILSSIPSRFHQGSIWYDSD